jgi:Tol biopolymer transport system component
MILDKSGVLRSWKLGAEGATLTRSFATLETDDNLARYYELQISRDERWMALTATNAPHLVVYDTSANPPRRAVPRGAPEMNGAPTFSDDGHWLAYATDKSVELWLTARLDQAPWVLGSPSRVVSLAFSSDGGKLTFGTERGELSLASLAGDRPALLANMKAQQGSIQLVGFSQDSGQAFSVSYQEARLWPLKP